MVHEIKDVKPIGQQTPYSCGIGALETIFHFMGKPIGDNLKYIGEAGTSHGQLMEIAKANGLVMKELDGSIGSIEMEVMAGNPVIVNYQDYGPNDGENGHYAVVTGFAPERLKFADPADGGKTRWVEKSWFEERWSDPYEPGQAERWSAVFEKKTP